MHTRDRSEDRGLPGARGRSPAPWCRRRRATVIDHHTALLLGCLILHCIDMVSHILYATRQSCRLWTRSPPPLSERRHMLWILSEGTRRLRPPAARMHLDSAQKPTTVAIQAADCIKTSFDELPRSTDVYIHTFADRHGVVCLAP